MMNPIVLFDLIFFIASLTALIILLKSWKRTIKRDIKLFFAGLLVFTTGYSFCLVLEWSGITKALDPFEDFLGALLPMWWAFLLYALLQEMVNRDQRESEEKYRNVVERANDGITIIQDGRIKFVNRFLAEMTGRTVEEVTGTYFTDYLHPLEVPKLAERYERRFAGEDVIPRYESIIRSRDGVNIDVEFSAGMIIYDGETADLVIVRNITERKQLESQVQYAQRMESLGTLAGGIAHDFNNLLMGVQGNASLMLLDKDSDHPDYEKLKNIEQYIQNGVDLTKQLLGFARGGKYEVKPTDIKELIKNQNRMFGRTRKEIIIREKYEKDLWLVDVDRGQIRQVLLNLYVNAWQAMPGGGDLYIQVENVRLDETYVMPFDIEPGNFVKIAVTDTGVGMDAATRQKIFEPFFTTREMGRGTGLGLASVYGIIKNHGGLINVCSEKGEGTTFNIYLPATEKKQIDPGAERDNGDIQSTIPPRRRPLGAGGDNQQSTIQRVLLVDDEEMIIDVAKQLCEKLGYKVMIAGSGKEAIEIYDKSSEKIDIVILDMIMPDMGGSETYDRLKELNPDIKVLLSSGYSVNGQATEILERGCNGFIQKPFTMKALSQKIREILKPALSKK